MPSPHSSLSYLSWSRTIKGQDKNSRKKDKKIYLFETEDTFEPRSEPCALSGLGGRCEGDFLFSSNCIFLSLIEKLSLGNNFGPGSKFSKIIIKL